MPRKRAPGAGRKPKGEFAGKAATFTTRIRPDTRSALEQGAQRSGLSLSQYVEFLLRHAALKPSGKEEQRNQALARAIATLAENIERATGLSWKNDAFTAQAVRSAIDALLFRFAPGPSDSQAVPAPIEGMAAKMPQEFAARYRAPTGLGQFVAFALISEIESERAGRNPDEWTAPVMNNIAYLLAPGLGPKEGEEK